MVLQVVFKLKWLIPVHLDFKGGFVKKYLIGGIEFTQDKISLKDLRSLVTILSQVEYPKELTVFKLIGSFGNKLPEMFALILKSENPVDNRVDFLDSNINDEQVVQIIEDFLALRPTYKKLLNLLPLLK